MAKRELRWTWLANRRVMTKIAVTFGSLLLLFAVTCGLFFVSQQRTEDARRWTAHSFEVLLAGEEINGLVLDQQRLVRNALIYESPDELAGYRESARRFDDALASLVVLVSDNPQQRVGAERVGELMDDYREIVVVPMLAVEGRRGLAALRAPFSTEDGPLRRGAVVIDQLFDQLTRFMSAERKLLAEREARLDRSKLISDIEVLGMLGLGIFIGWGALRLASRSIAGPLEKLTRETQELAGGRLDIELSYRSHRDEVGDIARALEVFQDAARNTADREWIKTYLASISVDMGSEATPRALAAIVLSRLCPVVELPYGALFYRDAEQDTYEPIGSHGAQPTSKSVREGEGLVGQCVRTRSPMRIDALPADYVRIESGLGAATPRVLYLWPLITAGGNVVGVLELAGFQALDVRQQELVAELTKVMSLALESLGHAQRTRQLLEETQAQAEELHASQEALRGSNETLQSSNAQLEEQSQQLRASEEELRVQQEELQSTNEELEEKSRTLGEFNEQLQSFRRELEQRNQDLEQASQYKSEFLANMSHELRTPLNSLLILAKTLADNDEGNLSEDQIESARIVFESGTNLLQLINDILDLSKIEAGKMEVVTDSIDLPLFAAGLKREYQHVARQRGLDFRIDIAAEAPELLQTDSHKLRQILVNLIGNAFKFTSSGGVSLRIEPVREQRLLGRVPAFVRLVVTDTGIGIPAEKLERIFQAFEQVDSSTSRKYGGTGLGLSIVRGLATMLGGEIGVHSREGEGSSFSLILPETPPAEADRPSQAPLRRDGVTTQAPQPPTILTEAAAPVGTRPAVDDDRDRIAAGDTVILAVEDDPVFLKILVDVARKKGFRVLAALDGASALSLAEQYRPTGVLLDVALPGMSGLDVIERLKRNPVTRTIPVHMISAGEESAKSLELGAVGFLHKPVSKEGLDQAFDRVMHFASNGARTVLVVDDDDASRVAVRKLLSEAQVELTEAATAADGLKALQDGQFDCVILDLGLPDGTGFDLLEQAARSGPVPPVVVYSARELTREENLKLHEYTDSIVIKGARSPERLLDEVSLFLHAIRRESASAPALAPSTERSTDLAGKTVLVVDDDMRNVFALSKALRSRGLNVVVAQDGFKALEQLEKQPVMDIVLMDIMMPGMDGYETMRRIRGNAQWLRLPIIALTAKAMRGDREKCLEAGANDYLSKPIDVERLVSLMRVWVGDDDVRKPLA